MKVLLVNVAMLLVVKICYGGTPTADAIRKPVTHLEIKFASLVYRHGDLAVIDPYPKDPWRNPEHWPEAFGQLTNTGINQHYLAGKMFRERYSSLISEKYNPEEVSVRSTDVDSTLMSAQANLAGMYSPVNESVWNKNLFWRPIPVHTLPADQDPILAMGKKCTAYDRAKNMYLRSREYTRNLRTEENLMSYLTENSGRTIKSFKDVLELFNTLCIESIYNFTLPAWTADVFPYRMVEASLYSLMIPTATPKLAKYKVGPILKEITEAMQSAVKAKKTGEKYKKMTIYSAHDDTIANILNALNMFKPHFPAYTSTIHFELVYDNATMLHSVRILYRSTTKLEDPIALVIPECGTICPLDSFLRIYKGIIPNNWDDECKDVSNYFIILVVIMLVFVVILHFVAWWNKYLKDARAAFKREKEVVNLDTIAVGGRYPTTANTDAASALLTPNAANRSVDAADLALDSTDHPVDAANLAADAAGNPFINNFSSIATTIGIDTAYELSVVDNHFDAADRDEVVSGVVDEESAQSMMDNEHGHVAPAHDVLAIRDNNVARITALHPM